MLQRIQSIWLLLAGVFAAITFRFPFYSGLQTTPLPAPAPAPITGAAIATTLPELNAYSTLPITVLTVLTGALAIITIFFFNNRKQQLKMTYTGLFMSVFLLVLYFFEMRHFASGNVTLWVIFYFFLPVSFILAARGIHHDEKLIKSMDRLR